MKASKNNNAFVASNTSYMKTELRKDDVLFK
jgi:hypothetical protein